MQRPRSLPPARALPRTRCRACRPGRAHAHLRPLRAAYGAPQPFPTLARLSPNRCVLEQPPSFDQFQALPSIDFFVRKAAAVTQKNKNAERFVLSCTDGTRVGGGSINGLGTRFQIPPETVLERLCSSLASIVLGTNTGVERPHSKAALSLEKVGAAAGGWGGRAAVLG